MPSVKLDEMLHQREAYSQAFALTALLELYKHVKNAR